MQQLQLVKVGEAGMFVSGQHILSLTTPEQLLTELSQLEKGAYRVGVRKTEQQTVVDPKDYAAYLKAKLAAVKRAITKAKRPPLDQKTQIDLILTLRQQVLDDQVKIDNQDAVIEKLLKVAQQSQTLTAKPSDDELKTDQANDLTLWPAIDAKLDRIMANLPTPSADEKIPTKPQLINLLLANLVLERPQAKAVIDQEYGQGQFEPTVKTLQKQLTSTADKTAVKASMATAESAQGATKSSDEQASKAPASTGASTDDVK